MPNATHHLKEDDELISYIRRIADPTRDGGVEAAFVAVQALLDAHRASPSTSELRQLCPSFGSVLLPLDLGRALREYDVGAAVTRRRFVAPSFRETREVLNLAVTHAVASRLRLVTLDADDTIYSDRGSLAADSPVVPLLCALLMRGIHVSIVTAAAYPGEPRKMESRIGGLLQALGFAIDCGAPAEALLERLHVMCGECNYLLEPVVWRGSRDSSATVMLREVPGEAWKNGRGVRWDHAEVARLLDTAATSLVACAERLGLEVLVVRKPRAVGIIERPRSTATREAAAVVGVPATATVATTSHVIDVVAPSRTTPYGGHTRGITFEVLEEVALGVQQSLADAHIEVPYCVFNGGHDVFVDVGTKALGIRALQARVGCAPEETVHYGDRFTRTGWVPLPHRRLSCARPAVMRASLFIRPLFPAGMTCAHAT